MTFFPFFHLFRLFEHGDVDTLPFRQAIWYYTLQIKGMKHDDFNYQKVNECLNVNFKRYIKNVACYPQSIKAHDFQSMVRCFCVLYL